MNFYLTYFFIAIGLFGFSALFALFGVYAERKVSAFIQDRLGPTETGKYGSLQTFADILKMLQKELIIPAAADKPIRPVGDWNTARIVVHGKHGEHWLNGVKVVEYELWTPDWERRVRGSKFKDFASYGRARRGHIGLQDHGDKVAFRNIKIRPLQAP